MRDVWIAALMLGAATSAFAAEVDTTRDAQTGWMIFAATAGDTSIKVVPAAGCNVYSIKYKGREILKQPAALADLPGFRYGTPVLYPSPNRVRNATFSFGGRTYRFDANNDTNFLHGIVHNVPWQFAGTEANEKSATLHFRLDFKPGSAWYERFPLPHVLKLDVRVTDHAVRWTYTVDNSDGQEPIPFGFALHPWILYQGKRADTYLTVPATHWMEAANLLPTGKLIELGETKFDARQPKSLESFVIDDVYFGMTADHPTLVDFRSEQLKIALKASSDFTHLVVYTPAGEPWFCVENQTCSTDAHNLYAQGKTVESHLLIVQPGGRHTGTVEYRFRQ